MAVAKVKHVYAGPKDPETGDVIGYEAFFLGNARLLQPGEPAVLEITVAPSPKVAP